MTCSISLPFSFLPWFSEGLNIVIGAKADQGLAAGSNTLFQLRVETTSFVYRVVDGEGYRGK